ncbi:uncharacterized protein RHO17_025336 [Thomomys bottae]
MARVVKHLLSTYEALSSNPNLTKAVPDTSGDLEGGLAFQDEAGLLSVREGTGGEGAAVSLGFNLDTENPTSFQVGSAGFGYSVVQYSNSWVVVGAPREIRATNQTGGLYKCDYATEQCQAIQLQGAPPPPPLGLPGSLCLYQTSPSSCTTSSVSVVTTCPSNSSVPQEAVNMSLGLSLAASSSSSQLLACGPTVQKACKENIHLTGFCFLLASSFVQQQRLPAALQGAGYCVPHRRLGKHPPPGIHQNAQLREGNDEPISRNWCPGVAWQFSLMQFSHKMKIHFTFRDFARSPNPQNLMQSVRQLHGFTHTATAIDIVRKDLFTAANGARRDATKILIVITDGDLTGDSKRYRDVIPQAEKAGIIRYAIGVGEAFRYQGSRDELVAIASYPSWEHIFNVENFDALKKIQNQLKDKIFAIEGTEMRSSSSFELEMAQEGFSAAFSPDGPVLGAVGSFSWSGGAFLYPPAGAPTFINKSQESVDMRDSYLGEEGLWAAAGKWGRCLGAEARSPQVTPWRWPSLRGNGAWSWGPLVTSTQGRLSCSPRNRGNGGQMLKSQGPRLAPTLGHPWGRFGAALTVLGDVNGDKLTDVAIGAPGEQENRGAVYIFHGTSGLDMSPGHSQRIAASQISSSLQYFGQSLSGGQDVTQDGLVDLAVGSQGRVLLLRTRPVLRVAADLRFSPAEVARTLFECQDQAASVQPLGHAIVCLHSSESSNRPLGKLQSSVTFDLALDPGRPIPRAIFKDTKTRILRWNQVLGLNTYCKQVELLLPDCVEDPVTPITLRLNLSLVGLPLPSLRNLSPMLDKGARTYFTASLPFEKNCGADHICQDDLDISFNFSGVKTLVVGNNLDLNVEVMVSNDGEDSYGTTVTFVYPAGLSYRRANGSQLKQNSLQQRPLTLTCSSTQPEDQNLRSTSCRVSHIIFHGATKISFLATFDVSPKAMLGDRLLLTANVSSENNSPRTGKTTFQRELPVKYAVYAVVSSQEEFTKYLNFSAAEQEQSGMVKHGYQVHNLGQRDLPLRINFWVPVKVGGAAVWTQAEILHSQDCSIAECLRFRCDIPSFGIQEELDFTLQGNLSFGWVSQTMQKKVLVMTVAEITFDTAVYSQVPGQEAFLRAQIKTVLEKYEVHNPVPLIVGSSAGGLLLLALVTAILYKVGFFKRRYKHMLEEANEQQKAVPENGVAEAAPENGVADTFLEFRKIVSASAPHFFGEAWFSNSPSGGQPPLYFPPMCCSLMMGALDVLLLLGALAFSHGFNLDVEESIVFRDDEASFGQTVVQFGGSRLVVGAPLQVVTVNQTGQLYDCAPNTGTCQPISLHIPPEFVNMSLGLSLATSINQSLLLACGPTMHRTCGENTYAKGSCLLLDSRLQLAQTVPDTLPDCSHQEMDVAFLIDGSGSIEQSDFSQMKDFVRAVIGQFQGTNTMFSLMQYSNILKTHFTFTEFRTSSSPQSLVDPIVQLSGLTFTATGILKVVKELFHSKNGARENARKILIVITDGQKYRDPLGYHDVIPQAEEAGIIRYAIGVGDAFQEPSARQELDSIGSSPPQEHVFKVGSFMALGNIQKELQEKIFAVEGTGSRTSSNFQHEMSQEGFSSAFAEDGPVLGAVGSFSWSGGAFLYPPAGAPTFINKSQESVDMRDSYLGYSMEVAFSKGKRSLVLGAPRHQHTGKVVMFTQESGQWRPNAEVTGTQIGSYFGASLSSVDVNRDGITDLVLIGSPHYYGQTRGGQVSVCPMPKGRARWWCGSVLRGEQGHPWGRFGAALTVLGDVNGDKLTDVAIGAPGEQENRGAVYIFHGTSGLNVSPGHCQRIPSSQLSSRLQYFGQSLSGGQDLTQDGLVDLAVGAQGHVVLLRSLPVLKVEISMGFAPVEVAKAVYQCWKEGLPPLEAAVATICLTIHKGSFDHLDAIQSCITYDLALDPGRPISRAIFHETKNWTLTRRKILGLGDHCESVKLLLPDCVEDVGSPIILRLNFSLVEGPSSFWNLRPVLAMGSQDLFTASLPFEENCGQDSRCESDLRVNFSFSGLQTLMVGSCPELNLTVTVWNEGEDSYGTVVTFYYPAGLAYQWVSGTQEPHRHPLRLACQEEPTQSEGLRSSSCNINHPTFQEGAKVSANQVLTVLPCPDPAPSIIPAGSLLAPLYSFPQGTFIITFEVSSEAILGDRLLVRARPSSPQHGSPGCPFFFSSKNNKPATNETSFQLELPVKYLVNPVLSRQEDSTKYFSFSYLDQKTTKEAKHRYRVNNLSQRDLAVSVTFWVPILLNGVAVWEVTVKTPGQSLPCVSERELPQRSDFLTQIPTNSVLVRKTPPPPRQGPAHIKPFRKTKKTRNSSYSEESWFEASLDCSTAECLRFRCDIPSFGIQEELDFTLQGNLSFGWVSQTMQKKVLVMTVAEITLDTAVYSQVPGQEAFLRAQMETVLEEVKVYNPMFLLVGSSTGGLLLLALITAILYKFGFFRRHYKEMLDVKTEDPVSGTGDHVSCEAPNLPSS